MDSEGRLFKFDKEHADVKTIAARVADAEDFIRKKLDGVDPAEVGEPDSTALSCVGSSILDSWCDTAAPIWHRAARRRLEEAAGGGSQAEWTIETELLRSGVQVSLGRCLPPRTEREGSRH